MLVAGDGAWEAVCTLKILRMCTRKAVERVLSGLVPLSGTWRSGEERNSGRARRYRVGRWSE